MWHLTSSREGTRIWISSLRQRSAIASSHLIRKWAVHDKSWHAWTTGSLPIHSTLSQIKKYIYKVQFYCETGCTYKDISVLEAIQSKFRLPLPWVPHSVTSTLLLLEPGYISVKTQLWLCWLKYWLRGMQILSTISFERQVSIFLK